MSWAATAVMKTNGRVDFIVSGQAAGSDGNDCVICFRSTLYGNFAVYVDCLEIRTNEKGKWKSET